PLLRERPGAGARGQGRAERGRLLVGPVPVQHRQLLARQHRARRDQRDLDRFAQPGLSVPGFLPELCRAQTNVGTGNPVKEAVLAYCAEAAIGDPTCEWYTNPGKPGSSAAAAYQRRTERLAKRILATAQLAAPQCSLLGGLGGTISCAGYGGRP